MSHGIKKALLIGIVGISLVFLSCLIFYLVCIAQVGETSPGRIYVDITSPGQRRLQVVIYGSGNAFGTLKPYVESDMGIYGVFAPMFSSTDLKLDDLKLVGAIVYVKADTYYRGNEVIASIDVFSVEDGSVLLRKTFSSSRGNEALLAHKIVDAIFELLTGRKGILSREVVAVRKVAGGNELVLIDVGTRKYRRILFSTSPILSPSFSPDRSKVLFSMMIKGDFDIYELDLATGTYRKVCATSGPDSTPVYSPDGAQIAFTGYTSSGEGGVFLCDPQSSMVKPLIVEKGVINTSPSWSPDGKKLAYVSNRAGRPNIYVYDFETKRSMRISSGRYDVDPDWSPDGEKIAYSSLEGGWILKVYFLKTGSLNVLDVGEDPSFSANSDYIVYVKAGSLFVRSVYGNFESRVLTGIWQNPYWR